MTGKQQEKTLKETTTVTIEFLSDTEQHLRTLEHRLKHIRDAEVELVKPRERTAPVLISISIDKRGERGEKAAQNVAQTLHDFLHEDTGQKKIFLVTIEGERIDIEPLSTGEIQGIIAEAKEEEEE